MAPARTPLTNLTNNSPFQQQQRINNLLFQQQQQTNNLQYPKYSNFTEHLDEVTARCEAVCNQFVIILYTIAICFHTGVALEESKIKLDGFLIEPQ